MCVCMVRWRRWLSCSRAVIKLSRWTRSGLSIVFGVCAINSWHTSKAKGALKVYWPFTSERQTILNHSCLSCHRYLKRNILYIQLVFNTCCQTYTIYRYRLLAIYMNRNYTYFKDISQTTLLLFSDDESVPPNIYIDAISVFRWVYVRVLA